MNTEPMQAHPQRLHRVRDDAEACWALHGEVQRLQQHNGPYTAADSLIELLLRAYRLLPPLVLLIPLKLRLMAS